MSDLAIDRALAAVRFEIEEFDREADKQGWYYPPSDRHGKDLRAALAILEAVSAFVAADMIEPGLLSKIYAAARGRDRADGVGRLLW